MPRWFSRRLVPAAVVRLGPRARRVHVLDVERRRSGRRCTCTPAGDPTLTFAAYSTPREVYDAKIIPAFKAMWKDKTGVEPQFFESYTGSTTQAQNVVNGSGADVVALSLAPDVRHDRRRRPDHARLDPGARRGHGLELGRRLRRAARQPEGHQGLERPRAAGHRGPDARPRIRAAAPGGTSCPCGARRFAATCPASRRTTRPAHDADAGRGRQRALLRHQRPQLDPELRGRQRRRRDHLRERGQDRAGQPACQTRPCTRRLDPDREPGRGRRQERRRALRADLANAFVDFLHTKEAKELLHDTGFLRSTDPTKAQKGDPANGFPAIKDLFTVDDLGGWDALDTTLFWTTGSPPRRLPTRADGSDTDEQRRAAIEHRSRTGRVPHRTAAVLRHLAPARRRPRLPGLAGRPARRRRHHEGVRRRARRVPHALAPRARGPRSGSPSSRRRSSAAINAVMGTTLAWVLVRYRFPGRRVLSTVVDLPLAIPTLVTGVMSWCCTDRTR